MARSNGGIIGKTNKTSFGKCTQTVVTSDGCHTTQPGTGVVKVLLVGGGAGGGNNQGGGGGAGGAEVFNCVSVNGNTAYPIDIGAGGEQMQMVMIQPLLVKQVVRVHLVEHPL